MKDGGNTLLVWDFKERKVLQTLVTALVNILVQTYGAVCLTLLYFDLRIRKEGFDLELAARQQATPTVS